MQPQSQHTPPVIPLTSLYTGQIAFTETNGVANYAPQNITPKILTKQEVFAAQRTIMLNNYRYYVQAYSDMCSQWNKEVNAYNHDVKHYILENECGAIAECETERFRDEIGKVSISEYNAAAKIRNEKIGQPLIALKKHVSIKKPTESVFAMILFKYSMQINAKNAILEGCGAVTTRAIQRVSINPYELANTVIDGIVTLPYSKRTIQNHISRLVDAGILFDSVYRGTNKPVEYHINESILAIYDHKTRKTLTAENQLFNPASGKKLHHNDIVTRTIKDKIKITEIVEKQSPLKGALQAAVQSFVPHDNQSIEPEHQTANSKKNPPGSAKTLKNSAFLRKIVSPGPKLIQDLTNGVYDNYNFTLRNNLEHEAMYGNLDKDEFRHLLIQIFCMMAAPIWRDKDVYIGSWYKAFEIINDEFIMNFNDTVPGKITAMFLFDKLVFRLTAAKTYFRDFPDFRPLFPSQYFDPTRKTKGSGGFGYTIEALKKSEAYAEMRRKRKEKRNAAAIVRNANEKARELVKNKVNEYKNSKINFDQLYDYVINNAHIPKEIAAELSIHVRRAHQC